MKFPKRSALPLIACIASVVAVGASSPLRSSAGLAPTSSFSASETDGDLFRSFVFKISFRRDTAYARSRVAARSLDDRTLAARLLLTGVEGSGPLAPSSRSALRDVPVGGVMLFKYNLGRGASATRALAADCAKAVLSGGGASRVPPFIAADHEGGYVHRFGADAVRLPAPGLFMRRSSSPSVALGSIHGSASRSAAELRALGVNLVLAPVAESVDAGNRAVMEGRSYGADAVFAAASASAFVAGMSSSGVACVVKHFPGNSGVDPHAAKSVLSGDRASLEARAAPFSRVFASARPAGVMVSHVVAEAVDAESPGSLSRQVVSRWLKGELGFGGFAVTDDLRMRAVADLGIGLEEAAVEAACAGADLIMVWPGDLRRARDALAAALAGGLLARERAEDAVARVEAAKDGIGLMDYAPPGIEPAFAKGKYLAFRAETERYLRERGLE